MKPLLLALLCFFNVAAHSTNYYFSSSTGDDSRTNAQAQNSSTPWRTLSKLNSIFSGLNPGDSILFKRGDEFAGFITISKSGSTAAPIVLGAYGSGAKPVITGFSDITGWTPIGNGIYEKAVTAAQGTLNMVTFNGSLQPLGRFPKVTAPNAGYLTVGSHSANSSVTANAANGGLSGAPNFNGAEIVIRKNAWILDRGLITNHSGSTIAYSSTTDASHYWPTVGYGFFIQNHVNTLTSLGDWCYEPAGKKLKMYFGGNDPASFSIKASVVENLVNIPDYLTSNIIFDNLAFTGANSMGFNINSNDARYLQINNCDISYSGVDGINIGNSVTSNIKLANNTISYSNNNAITANGSKSWTITNNVIRNTGMVRGAGGSGGGQYVAMNYIGGNSLIKENKVINTGYIGIHFVEENNITVQNNFIDTFCVNKDDGGGIYSYSGVPTVNTGRKVIDNIVLNGTGAFEGTSSTSGAALGIYMDDNVCGVEIKGNTVANCSYAGIYVHNSRNLDIQNNTSYNNSYQWCYYNNAGTISGLNIRNNIFFSRLANQFIGTINNEFTNTNSWGTINNNYYCRPLAENNAVIQSHAPTYQEHTLSVWRTLTGHDINSTGSPVAITSVNQIRFEYNASNTNKVVSLGANYVSANGTLYAGTITLAPYSSAVLLQSGATNQPPTANAGPDQSTILPINIVTLNGSGTDPDGTIASYQWTKVSGNPLVTITLPGLSSTTIVAVLPGVYQFELKVTDNLGAVDTDTVSVNVGAGNVAPTANAGTDQTITLPISTVTVNGSGNDPDGTIASYLWTKITGPAANIVSATSASTVINSLSQGVYQFELKVTDNQGAVGKDTVTITVNAAANQAPTADAGINQSITLPTSTVSVNGSGNDPDGSVASYLWTKITGPAANIVSSTQASTVINSLSQGLYQFELKVTDNQGAVGRDTVTITVNAAANQAPTADAGINQVITLPVSTVTVNGSGNDPDGTIASYLWTKITGPAANIVSSTLASTVINTLTQGVYQFELRVTDNQGAIGRDTVTITVNAAIPNVPPTANAGINQNITLPTNTVTVNGSGNDPDGSIASYLWTKITGPAANIVSSTLASTVINTLTQGVYQFELRVTDNQGAIGRDTVTITVNAAIPNVPPTANAGINQNITLPTNSVTVNGSGNDPDGSIASYQWTKITGGAANIVSATSASTVINSLTQGVYEFELRVTDNQGAIGRDTVTITVNGAIPNVPPTANAGINQNITLPTNAVTVNGSGNDPDGTIASYLWTKITGGAANIVSATSASTVINSLTQGVYQFELRVTDNQGAIGRDTVTITVNAAIPNVPPTANAGINQNITLPTNSVTVNGSGNDPDGSIASYLWTKIAGGTANIVSSTSASTVINSLTQGVYQFELRVTDNQGAIGRDTVTITVNAAIPNVPPTANAGINQNITLPTNSVTVNGSGNDPDGSIASYLWTKITGGAANIVSATSASTVINSLTQGVYQFELRVTDNQGAIGRDTVTITVNAAANVPPTANAGTNQNITLPTNSVTVNGSGNDPDGTIASYLWTKITGGAANIVSATSASTVINSLTQGVYQFELRVTDNQGAIGRDTITITVNAAIANVPPVVNAGVDQTITLPTNNVTVTAAANDPDGTIASYQWTKIAGPSANIVSATSSTTNIKNLSEGTYQFLVTVRDNSGATATDIIRIIVTKSSSNKKPTSKAGRNATVILPTNTVTLDGSGTDLDGVITSYSWRMVSSTAAAALAPVRISNPNAPAPEVSELAEGHYEFELTVTDDGGDSATDTVTVEVKKVDELAVSIYPNPASTITNLKIEAPSASSQAIVEIYNMAGKMVYRESFVRTNGATAKQISVATLSGGTYLVKVTCDKKTATIKLVKQ